MRPNPGTGSGEPVQLLRDVLPGRALRLSRQGRQQGLDRQAGGRHGLEKLQTVIEQSLSCRLQTLMKDARGGPIH